MKYTNHAAKKIKNSHLMIISCGVCKEELIIYQKVGTGQLLKLFVERILACEMGIGHSDQLTCPKCQNVMGYKVRIDGKLAYKMTRNRYNTRIKHR